MKNKKIIVDKTVYGGVMADKYFLHFDDRTDMQVPFCEWDQFEVGDEYIVSDVPDPFCGVDPDPFVEALKTPGSFVDAMKDIVAGKTVPLDKALNEEPPIDWKQMHDMQQKLVISYVLENEKLKDRIKELEKPSEKVDKICEQIEEVFRKRDYYKIHSHVLETANDELDRVNKIVKDTLINIWECFEMRDELYTKDWRALQALANKAFICLEEIGYEWRKDK